MSEVLGIDEVERLGGFDEQELRTTSWGYKEAVIEAAKKGEPIPDIEEWLAAQDGEEVEDSSGLDD